MPLWSVGTTQPAAPKVRWPYCAAGGARMPGAPGARQAQERLEVRSYEAAYVHGLWHSDFHHGSRRVLAIPETVYYLSAMLFSNYIYCPP